MSKEGIQQNNEDWRMKGGEFWTAQIMAAGLDKKMRFFNDVLLGKDAPLGYGDEPALADVVLDGHVCDIYHTDRKPNDSFHRIYIHLKDVQ